MGDGGGILRVDHGDHICISFKENLAVTVFSKVLNHVNHVRNDIAHETDRVRDAGFSHHHRIRETASAAANAEHIAAFLTVPPDTALELAKTEHLFAD